MPTVRRQRIWTRKPPMGVGINWGHALSNGLVACWPFNERSGLPVEIVSGITGTKHGSPTWSSDESITEIAGGNNYFSWSSLNPAHISLFSLERFTGVTGDDSFVVSREYLSGNVPFRLSVATSVDYQAKGFAFYDGQWRYTGLSVDCPNDGMFHASAGTYDGANAYCYLDGKQVGTLAYASSLPSNASPINIGVYSSYGFAGSISLVAMWDRALSPIEIARLSFNPWQIFQPAPGPWLFGSGGGAFKPYWTANQSALGIGVY